MKKRAQTAKRQQPDKNYIGVTAKIFAVLECCHSGRCSAASSFVSGTVQGGAVCPYHGFTAFSIPWRSLDMFWADAKAHYHLGPKFFALTQPAVPFRRLQSVAHAVMLELLVRHSETVNLGVLDDGQVAYIGRRAKSQRSAYRRQPGRPQSGAQYIAWQGDSRLSRPKPETEKVLKQYPLIRMT